MDNVITTISNSVSASDSFCTNLISDLQKCQKNLSSRHEFDHVGKQMMNDKCNFTFYRKKYRY